MIELLPVLARCRGTDCNPVLNWCSSHPFLFQQHRPGDCVTKPVAWPRLRRFEVALNNLLCD